MKTSTHRIYTSDGIELFGLLYESDTPSTTVLVHIHGMAGNFYENAFLDAIAKTLTDNGISFCVFNNRGCEYIKDLYRIVDGKKTIVRIGDAFERFEDCEFDIDAAIGFVKEKGYSSIHLSGHSLGAPKVAYYSAEKGVGLASVIFLSPADMVGLALKEKNREWEFNTAEKMIADGKGGELLPGPVWWDCYLSANTIMSLCDKQSKVAIFNLYDPEDKMIVLSKIKSPVLTIMGKKDDALVIPVEKTMDRIRDALTGSKHVESCILGDADHLYIGYEDKLADRLLQWIRSTIAK